MSRRPWLLLVITLAACEKGGSEQPTAGIKPKNPAPPASDAAPVASRAPCPWVVVVVKPDGVWIRDPKTQSVIAPCGGELDGAALRDRLCAAARGSLPDCAAVEVAAEPGVRYQQLIAVMDAAIAVGLRDVGLTEPGSVSFPLRVPPDPGSLGVGSGALRPRSRVDFVQKYVDRIFVAERVATAGVDRIVRESRRACASSEIASVPRNFASRHQFGAQAADEEVENVRGMGGA